MIGAIVGDICGSIYESWIFQDSVNDLNFNLYSNMSAFTDDTCLTVAIADAILENVPYEEKLCEWYHKYPNKSYGSSFVEWAEKFKTDKLFKHDSYGNGAMMRISPLAYAFDDLDIILKETKKSIEYTHNTEEAYNGASAIVTAIFLARIGKSKHEIKNYISSKYSYDLNYTTEYIRDNFDHRTTRCNVSATQALCVFFNSVSYEDTIRKAIYTKGDCDTIAAISGSIAYAFYKNIPDNMKMFAFSKLPGDIKYIINKFNEKYKYE